MTADLHARIAKLEADLAKAREERDTIQRLLSRQVRQDGARGRRKDNEIDALTAERDALLERVEKLEGQTLSGAWVQVGPDMRWAQVQRLRFIGHLIETVGRFNRRDLMVKFGISEPQASTDIGAFKDWNPHRVNYDASLKCYLSRQVVAQDGEKG